MAHEHQTYTKLKPLNDSAYLKSKKALFEIIGLFPEVKAGSIGNFFKGSLKEYLHQALATLAIFIIFFVVINWSAIYQVVSWEAEKISNKTDQVNPLYRLVEKEEVKQVPLPLVKTSDEAKMQIPMLNLTIAPPDTRLVIPRINKNVPVVNVSGEALITKDWNKLESDMQSALRNGVIHYPGTSYPGQQGNVVITGHSSYFPWDPGRFKDVFAVLHDLRNGDKILLYYNQQQYIYEVSDIKKIWPSELDVLRPTSENKLTLITCTPIGTNLKRLVVEAKLIGAKP